VAGKEPKAFYINFDWISYCFSLVMDTPVDFHPPSIYKSSSPFLIPDYPVRRLLGSEELETFGKPTWVVLLNIVNSYINLVLI
jgi:hypothetical protein